MSKPAFIVDGHMEKLIIHRLCNDVPIKRLDLNGKDVKLPAMANKIASLVRVMGNKFYPIIIIIDREQRKESAEKISNDLYNELQEKGVKDKLIIGVADRMTENWTLADWDSFKNNTKIKSKKTHKSFEGLNGKSKIKTLFSMYQETTHGVDFFVKSRCSVIKKNSPSFKILIEKIKEEKLKCHWMKR